MVIVNIFDTKEQKYIACNVTLQQAAKLLDMPYKSVSRAKISNSLAKYRYRIIHIDNIVKPNKEDEKLKFMKWFDEQWEEAVRPFRELARGKASV